MVQHKRLELKGVLSVAGWESCSGLGGDPRRFMARAYV